MSFQAGIFNALANDPLLDALVPAQVYPSTGQAIQPIFYGRLPAGFKLPWIMFFTTSGPPPDWTFEPDYIESIDFQVSIFHNIPGSVTAIAHQVDHLLCWTPLVFDDVRNLSVSRQSPLDNLILDPDVDEADQDVWMTPLLYQARLIRILT